MPTTSSSPITVVCLGLLLSHWYASCLFAATIPNKSLAFLQSHCVDCHDGSEGEGGFDVGAVSTRLDDPRVYESWVRIFDRIEKGEMPPPDDNQIPPAELRTFLPSVEESLNQAAKTHRLRDGRVQGRRLSNSQLQRTLQDLLHIDVPLARLMPPETRSSGYVHLADAQTMSHFQLENHLQVVDAALDAAFDRATLGGQDWAIDYGPEQIANKKPGRRNRDPELRQGLAVTWNSGLIFYGRISSTEVRESGWYRITITASSVKQPEHLSSVWCSVRSGQCTSSAPLLSWIGSFAATPEPQTMTWDAWIPAGEMLEIRPADTTLKRGNFAGGQVGFGEGEKQNVPGVALARLQMQRIFPGGDVQTVRKQLFGSHGVHYNSKIKRSEPNMDDAADEIVTARIAEQVEQFAQLAFRRPTDDAITKPFSQFAMSIWQERLTSGDSREQAYTAALRAGYRAVLCSPRFLYLTEYANADGQLDDWSIASRLSYFLTGSMPDEPLRQAAAHGTMRSREQLRQQTDRLLATPRGQRFVEDFAAQWLDLVDIDFTEPDQRLFKDFDIVVQYAMLAETNLFLQKLLDEDRPISELIGADYTFLNERLARYYEVDSALTPAQRAGNEPLTPLTNADNMQLVSLSASSHRGGLLSHGSILKVTANGNDTSPVLRGIWVCERILGDEIPPPPSNVPAVEPDIRGAKTIRELLAKHEADASCAACHRGFDPPGFALENFDAGGKWREQYRQLVGGKYKRGADVDASHTMLDGRQFETYDEFRQLIADDPATLAANLASQLLTYGTGAKLQFSDRPIVTNIVKQTQKTDHGFRDILHAVIASETFLNK
jgi:hypothetical protein